MTDAERNALRLVAHDAIHKLWQANAIDSLKLLRQQADRSIESIENIVYTECTECGIGFRLPSGRCDHCDTMFESP